VDFDDNADEAAFRAEVRALLAPHARPDALGVDAGSHDLTATVAEARAWQRTLAELGWAAPSWPREYGGRGLSAAQAVIWSQECARAGRGRNLLMAGLDMLGPTLIAHASEAQKQRFLEPTARGEIMWCQLFSEPGAGSDLAALATRGVLEGDTWVVNGQKLWSSFANHADWGFLLVRSDPDAPKHAGITFLLVDMRSPGVEVRPLIEMTGGNHFNEVFFSGVHVSDANRVGARGAGWAIARTTLANERLSIGAMSALEPVRRLFAHLAACGVRRGSALATEAAQLHAWARALDLLGARVQTKLARGENPAAEATLMKNAAGEVLGRAARLGLEACGDDALGGTGEWQHRFLYAPSLHIGGGTDDVMKNVAAEQVLGLPREPDPWRATPFAQLPRGGPKR
jgi:alkylation response protein AidB-like acyl-CoA dehydrogenase